MHVVATAGHVDHGKSTLVRALTGMEPDRWAEERRRGMTIDLGFAWTALPSGERIAFVDVPGHERFVTNMLAGVGPLAAVMIVVAADEGWMPQSAEHLAAIDALGVRNGLLAVTRADLADPGEALAQARARIAATSLGEVEAVVVSGVTGSGLPELRHALDRLAARLPAPDSRAPVRIWIDRAFTVTGSGTVVTGTLPAGTVRVGDELLLGDRPVRVRGIQSMKEGTDVALGTARVALNLRGVDRAGVRRGMALVTPGRWTGTGIIDVRLSGIGDVSSPGATTGRGRRPAAAGPGYGGRAADARAEYRLPRAPILHIGSAAVPVRLRPLGADTARVTFDVVLPLHVGDRVLLRDPGTRGVTGATVLDVMAPLLGRRGAGAARARELASWPVVPGAATILRGRGVMRRDELMAMGFDVGTVGAPVGDDWIADPDHLASLRRELADAVSRHAAANPLEPGLPIEAARRLLVLPDRRLVDALARDRDRGRIGSLGQPMPIPITVSGGRIYIAEPTLPESVARAVRRVRDDLCADPFNAPEADRLAELGLTAKALGAAVRAGALLKIADGVVLLPGAVAEAARILATLPQPFTVSQARQALGTSRRVAIPLLEHLDRLGHTIRVDRSLRKMG